MSSDAETDLQRATALAANALAAMMEQRVPPTPTNFSVWFGHMAGRVPEVTKTINAMIASGQPFSTATNGELHVRCLAADPSLGVLQLAGDRLTVVIAEAVKYLEVARTRASDYGKRLGDYSAELEAGYDATRLRVIVADLIDETKRVVDHNHDLEAQLKASSAEAKQLREMLSSLQQQASKDALTGIGNRGYFERELLATTQEAARTGDPMCLLLVDIDFFKRFNDTYGHAAGDQVLRLVARTLTDCVKGRDIVARFGGEEFAIILPKTKLFDAYNLSQQICRTLMGKTIVRRNSGDHLGNVTASIGVALYVPGEPVENLVERSDAALYFAKRNGRNCVATEVQAAAGLAQKAAG